MLLPGDNRTVGVTSVFKRTAFSIRDHQYLSIVASLRESLSANGKLSSTDLFQLYPLCFCCPYGLAKFSYVHLHIAIVCFFCFGRVKGNPVLFAICAHFCRQPLLHVSKSCSIILLLLLPRSLPNPCRQRDLVQRMECVVSAIFDPSLPALASVHCRTHYFRGTINALRISSHLSSLQNKLRTALLRRLQQTVFSAYPRTRSFMNST